MTAQFPEKLEFLFEPAIVGQPGRYKVLKGGRGGGKSENIAQALLILGQLEPCLILCTREVQRSIKDSVHAMLRGWIVKLGMQAFYDVTEHAIRGKNGTEFIFWGLTNIDSLKSIAQVRYCWVEEAQTVKKSSWDKLIPSIRWEDKERGIVSEIWVSYNPELDTDDTHRRFVLEPPSTATVVEMNYWDNPWFPEVLRVEMEDLRARSQEDYEHVWEGKTRQTVDGAIYAKELKLATAENRITSVPYNRTRPVDTIWDLGYGDLTAVWFAQSYDGFFNFIDYLEGDGETIDSYVLRLQRKNYTYGTHFIPYDGVDTIIHKKLAGNREMSIEQIMRGLGLKVRIVPKVFITDRLNAARTIFPQCRFDANKCADGIQALRHFQWGPMNDNGVHAKREPLHNWASHAAEAFTRAGQALKMPQADPPATKPPSPYPQRQQGGYAPFG